MNIHTLECHKRTGAICMLIGMLKRIQPASASTIGYELWVRNVDDTYPARYARPAGALLKRAMLHGVVRDYWTSDGQHLWVVCEVVKKEEVQHEAGSNVL